jgi:hypothetical protein
MDCNLNIYKFITLGIGAALILSGVVLKNGYANQSIAKLKLDASSKEFENLGITSFVIGWIIVLYGLSVKNFLDPTDFLNNIPKASISIISAILIMVGVFSAMEAKKKNKKVPQWTGTLFIIGWIGLGLSSGIGFDGGFRNFDWMKSLCGLGGAGLIILSMIKVLPEERKNKITDGFGMPLFTAGWGLFVLCNSCFKVY